MSTSFCSWDNLDEFVCSSFCRFFELRGVFKLDFPGISLPNSANVDVFEVPLFVTTVLYFPLLFGIPKFQNNRDNFQAAQTPTNLTGVDNCPSAKNLSLFAVTAADGASPNALPLPFQCSFVIEVCEPGWSQSFIQVV